ncbi:hypothetical protein KFZ58_17595 [Virgibacillus sp. NKC19-16]|uniref:hypothetical protein n=1 Tax=Virgibacillus salidurans TaxID=2831673 RepID=UPI001F28034F|nr:hypothetical protein [Virgibacillus sp. NKC19-16]UJL46148.1 hypothetical protein KFZ58_17595 [Virgibacillus sp. NKC19-16]
MPYKLIKLISNNTKPSQVLQHSGTNSDKTFDTFAEANAMSDELNTITVDSVQWEVLSVE